MILVTGGNGFIGKHVCAAICGKRNVLALDTVSSERTATPFIECDLRDEAAVARLFEANPIDTVVHLASLLNTASSQNPKRASEVNVAGSVNLFELARKHKVNRVVYGSSITAYGSVKDSGPAGVSEDAPAAPEEVYGGSKRYVEIVGAEYRAQGAFDFVAIRFASVIGPGSASVSSPWRSEIFEKLNEARSQIVVPFAADQALPLVHIDDAVEAAVRLVEADATKCTVYNSPSETWTFSQMAAQVNAINPEIEFVFGEEKVVGHPRKTDASRFNREFGFHPLTLEEHLRESAR